MPVASRTSKRKHLAVGGRRFALAALTAFLSGCAGQGVAPPSEHRPVMVDVLPAGSPCTPGWTCTVHGRFLIAVSEEPIKLQDDPHPVNVSWRISRDGWSFVRNNGVDIKRGPPTQHVSDKHYVAHFRATDGVVYKYWINLTNGTDTVTWDPTIMN